MIEVKNLTKKYGSYLAVDHLNFSIEKGKIYGFLGPNGAGKSTTMNMITGYLGATEGQVLVNSHDILQEPEEAKKSIGYLPEQPPLYMDMTPREYLMFVAELKKVDKNVREAMIADVMRITAIAEVQNRLIRQLSKGYRQRVGVAQALIGYPEVIILDEPTVGLDPKQIIEIRQLIKSLGKQCTVILSSHILSEISEVCDEVIVISKGKLVAYDKTENLSTHLEEKKRLEMTIAGTEMQVRELVRQMSEVQTYSVTSSDEPESWNVEMTIGGSADPRKKIFYQCAMQKCPILRMQWKTMNLEEVFLELTANGGEDQKSSKQKGAYKEENEQ